MKRAEESARGDRVRAHVKVLGRVQGVFFRATCREEAVARGLAGRVRNCADGSVEAAFEGPRAAVEDMIDWCRRGPPSAKVSGVAVAWEAPLGERSFRITA